MNCFLTIKISVIPASREHWLRCWSSCGNIRLGQIILMILQVQNSSLRNFLMTVENFPVCSVWGGRVDQFLRTRAAADTNVRQGVVASKMRLFRNKETVALVWVYKKCIIWHFGMRRGSAGSSNFFHCSAYYQFSQKFPRDRTRQLSSRQLIPIWNLIKI